MTPSPGHPERLTSDDGPRARRRRHDTFEVFARAATALDRAHLAVERADARRAHLASRAAASAPVDDDETRTTLCRLLGRPDSSRR